MGGAAFSVCTAVVHRARHTVPGKDDSGSVAFVSIVNALTLLGCVRCSHYPLRVTSGMKRDRLAARLHEHSAPGQSQHPRSPWSPRGVSCPPSPRENSGSLTLPATFSSYFSSRHTMYNLRLETEMSSPGQ